MRALLVEHLHQRMPDVNFQYMLEQRGMFSYSGLSKEAVHRLRDEFAIYAVDTGRICVAALNTKNVDYVSEGIAKVMA
jgi:aromatic-amino-acid transaminase